MASKAFICPRCGQLHILKADIFMDGVSGNIVDSNGKRTTFIDPTAEHHCEKCIDDILKEAMYNATNWRGLA